MVLRLVRALDVPPVEANAGLLSAGFAPVFPQHAVDDASVAMLRRAMSTTLANHSPWPAIACDAHWNLLEANPAAAQLLSLMRVDGCNNLIETLLLADDVQGPLLNWPEVARSLLQRLRVEALELPPASPLHGLIARLGKHPRLLEGDEEQGDTVDVVVPMRMKAGELELSFFSMIAQFGSVQEVTLCDVRLELFYPTDDVTTDYLASLVGSAK